MAHQLFKNKKDGMIFGVCAGLADWLGVDTSLLRILMVIGFFMSLSVTFWMYLLLAIFLPVKPE
jgi:phage shock protein C